MSRAARKTRSSTKNSSSMRRIQKLSTLDNNKILFTDDNSNDFTRKTNASNHQTNDMVDKGNVKHPTSKADDVDKFKPMLPILGLSKTKQNNSILNLSRTAEGSAFKTAPRKMVNAQD